MFHLKLSLRNVAIMVLINDPSFLLSSWWKKFFISLVLSIILVVSVVAEFRLYLEKFSISPLQAYSFRCWFSNNSVLTFLEGCFPSSFVAEVDIFFSNLLFQWYIFYSFFWRQCEVTLFDPSSRFVKIMFYSFAYQLNRSVVSFFKYPLILSRSCSVPSIFSRSAVQIISVLFLLYLV